jgi:hypothetical protein
MLVVVAQAPEERRPTENKLPKIFENFVGK